MEDVNMVKNVLKILFVKTFSVEKPLGQKCVDDTNCLNGLVCKQVESDGIKKCSYTNGKLVEFV